MSQAFNQQRQGTAGGGSASRIDWGTRGAVLGAMSLMALALALLVASLRLAPLRELNDVPWPPGDIRQGDARSHVHASSEVGVAAPVRKQAPASLTTLPAESGGTERKPDISQASKGQDSNADGLPVEKAAVAAPRAEREAAAQTGGRLDAAHERERDLIELPRDREAYQFISDLKGALESEAWEEAANIVTAPREDLTRSILPNLRDRALLTSLSLAVADVYANYPRAVDALGERFELLANLRVAEARQSADAAAMELAAAQFPGTEAAAQAQEWLGDLAMSKGQFAKALQQYERAAAAHGPNAEWVSARVRLAAAMMGRDADQPLTSAVSFGDMVLEPEAFEALVAEMRQRSDERRIAAVARDCREDAPSPTSWRLGPSSGDLLADKAGSSSDPTGSARPPNRRFAEADAIVGLFVHDAVYISWPGGALAYEIDEGQQRWSAGSSPAAGSRSARANFYKARSLVLGKRLLFRRATDEGMNLQCFDTATGRLLWQFRPGEHSAIASDPALIDERVILLAAAESGGHGVLRYLVIDPTTGHAISERDIVRLGSDWFKQGRCEVAADAAGLVVDVGAAVLRLDADGNLCWLRLAQRAQTQSEERRFVPQQPLVDGEYVYLVSQDTEALECLKLSSGQRRWMAELPSPARVAGIAEECVVVFGSESLSGVSREDGSLRWRVAFRQLACTPLVSKKHVLIAESEAVAKQNDAYQLRWTWLDIVSGKPVHSAVVSGWTVSRPRLAAAWPHQGGLLCLSQDGNGPWRLTWLEAASAAVVQPRFSWQVAGALKGQPVGDALP